MINLLVGLLGRPMTASVASARSPKRRSSSNRSGYRDFDIGFGSRFRNVTRISPCRAWGGAHEPRCLSQVLSSSAERIATQESGGACLGLALTSVCRHRGAANRAERVLQHSSESSSRRSLGGHPTVRSLRLGGCAGRNDD